MGEFETQYCTNKMTIGRLKSNQCMSSSAECKEEKNSNRSKRRDRHKDKERERQKRQMNCYGSKRLINLTEIDKVRCHYTLGRYLKRNNNNKRERETTKGRRERKKKV